MGLHLLQIIPALLLVRRLLTAILSHLINAVASSQTICDSPFLNKLAPKHDLLQAKAPIVFLTSYQNCELLITFSSKVSLQTHQSSICNIPSTIIHCPPDADCMLDQPGLQPL